ncbi:MAG: arylsulfatase [Planctomycetaceae bacterium]
MLPLSASFVQPLSVIALCILSLPDTAIANPSTPSGKATSRPNIIVILSDDMGFSDIGCYGGEAHTPVLDSLADGGLRFTQFYNTARCCPTRASLLTGLYPHQAGVGWMMNDNGHDGYRGELNQQCRTLGEVMRSAGYGTYAVGKWHVTKSVSPDGPKSNWPVQRGFDRFYGTIHGAGSFFDPNSLTRDNEQISPYADPEYQPKEYYYTDAISDHAVRFIDEHVQATPKRPFMMYVAYTAAHWPMHALPEDIAKYRGRFDAGYQKLREERLRRMKELGVVNADTELSDTAEDWETVEHRDWELRCMEVYAAMIDRMDQGIGRIVHQLKESGQWDNTLILFMQDNGGCAETLGRQSRNGSPSERAKGPTLDSMAAEALQRDMIPKQSRDGYPVIQGPGVMPGPADTYIAYGRGWANVSNTPFREYKHWVHEGGISTPLIAHWPAGIKRDGELEPQPGHLIDVMATCVDVSGASYPDELDGRRMKSLEGKSLVPAFNGKQIEREAIFWEHEGNRAVRQGNWKLVAKNADGPWELYDISSDRAELHDLAAMQPDRVASLARLWQAWAERANVLPLTPYWEKKTNALSSKKRFRLKQGDNLARSASPDYANKSFTITVNITSPGDNGVIVAQGGSAAGYALYLKNGKVIFAVREKGSLHESDCHFKAECTGLKVHWDASEQMVSIQQDDSAVFETRLPLSLSTMPQDGLQVGTDESGLVGDYTSENHFNGIIGSCVIQLH